MNTNKATYIAKLDDTYEKTNELTRLLARHSNEDISLANIAEIAHINTQLDALIASLSSL